MAGVSSELKGLAENGSNSAPQGMSGVTKVLAVTTFALSAVVVCLSIAVAATSGDSGSNPVASVEYKGIPTTKPPAGENICAGKKVDLPNIPCFVTNPNSTSENPLEDILNPGFALGTPEQAGANVTKGYIGGADVNSEPITNPYWMEGLCPVNVHWHLGTEHLSVGEYDENGKGPGDKHRKLAEDARLGPRCHYYDEKNPIFKDDYEWKHCVGMHVGETYEVHWPHSAMGACGTVNQYQTPFYDGVFCNYDGKELLKIGVQAQIFTIVDDEEYYYPDLIRGMIVDGEKGSDLAMYTGSTTGTSRDNKMCSQYTGITWQVDRKCHMISASSFDKMCADMKAQRDDMSTDLYAHGSREIVAHELTANNQDNRFLRDD